jgi:hypothetical protein
MNVLHRDVLVSARSRALKREQALSRDEFAISRWKESLIPGDCMTGRLGS